MRECFDSERNCIVLKDIEIMEVRSRASYVPRHRPHLRYPTARPHRTHGYCSPIPPIGKHQIRQPKKNPSPTAAFKRTLPYPVRKRVETLLGTELWSETSIGKGSIDRRPTKLLDAQGTPDVPLDHRYAA